MKPSYHFTDDMVELSGFGGSYEAACRAMVVTGLEWLDAHPAADPQYHGYQGLYGVITEDNDAAKALTAAVLETAWIDKEDKPTTVREYGATGAMHQAVIAHILWVRRHSWEEYCAESRRRCRDRGGS